MMKQFIVYIIEKGVHMPDNHTPCPHNTNNSSLFELMSYFQSCIKEPKIFIDITTLCMNDNKSLES